MTLDGRGNPGTGGLDALMRNAPVPLVDLGELKPGAAAPAAVVQAVTRALTDVGFMYVRGHGLEPSLIERAFATARRFFAAPRAVKDRCAYADIDANFGYQGLAVESLDPTTRPDLKESFTVRGRILMDAGASGWPSTELRDLALRFFAAGLAAGQRILGVLAAGLDLPLDFFTVRHRGENVTLRFLHYPRNLPQASDTQMGAGAHTDYGSITLLLQDDVGGLELLDAHGRWQPAPCIADALLINTGDLMQRWTNDRLRSTPHRVRPVQGARDRYSIALFVDPDPEVEIACLPGCCSQTNPPRYPPITAREHIRRKIAATHSVLQ